MSDANKKPFYEFIDNTRITCTITGVALLVIVWSFIGPGKFMFGNSIGKLIGFFILLYAAYNCFTTTTIFVKQSPHLFNNPKMNVEKNNVLLSYGFGALLIFLSVYVLKKCIW